MRATSGRSWLNQQRAGSVLGRLPAAVPAHTAAAAGLLVAWLVSLDTIGAFAAPHHGSSLRIAVVAIVTAAVAAVAVAVHEESRTGWWLAVGTLAGMLLGVVVVAHRQWPSLGAALAEAFLLGVVAVPWRSPGATPAAPRDVLLTGSVALETAALIGLIVHAGPRPLPLVVGGVALAVAAVVVRPRVDVDLMSRADADQARCRHARTQMSSLASGPDKAHVRLDSGAVVAYRVAAGVAVVAGDPLVDAELQPSAIREFVGLCRRTRCSPCFLQTVPELRHAYRSAGMRVLKFGEEALLDLTTFDLDTPRRANLRREVQRARRAGLDARTYATADVDTAMRAELEQVSRAWLAARPWPELGFSVGRFTDPVDPGGWFTVVRDRSRRIDAFTAWLPLGADGMAVDMMRRHPHAHAGAMDLCIVAALQHARARGLTRASLGVAPFRDQCGTAVDGRLAAAVRRLLFRSGTGGYRYAGLARFKAKFAPHWESRDVAVPRGLTGLGVPIGLLLVHFRTRAGR